MKDVGCSLLNQGSDSTPALDEGVMSHWAAGEVPLEVKCGPEEVLEPLRRHRVSHWSGTWFWKTAGLGCVLLTSPCSKASSQFGSTLSWKQFSPGWWSESPHGRDWVEPGAHVPFQTWVQESPWLLALCHGYLFSWGRIKWLLSGVAVLSYQLVTLLCTFCSLFTCLTRWVWVK